MTVRQLGEKELAADLNESRRHFMRGLQTEQTPSKPRFEFIRETEEPCDVRYSPLDRFTDEIRILYLLPHEGNKTAPIRCQMGHIPLGNVGPEEFQKYEALSYVWGSSDDLIPILVNGREFKITQNLHAALLKLRRETVVKAVWADAICINQDDTVEKSRQIIRMATIYEKAYCADLWLGETADDSDLAIDFMNSLSSVFLEKNEGGQVFTHKMKNISAELLELSEHENAAWVAVYKLFRRPYFSRTWTVQEQVVPGNNKCFICGDRTLVFWIAALHAYCIALDWNYFRLLHDVQTDEVTDFFPFSPDTW